LTVAPAQVSNLPTAADFRRIKDGPPSTKIAECAFATRAHTLSPVTIATRNMTTEVEISRATAGDAEAVYEIVLRALRERNARDYPVSVIDRLVLTLPEGVASKLEEWHANVAVVDGRTVGTGSLNGKTVGAVFVHPDYQCRGIGTKLMGAVEKAANVQSLNTLSVQSSITAQTFYAKRGFKVVREAFYGEERTIVMSKNISSSSE
jgi:GNAT superfamily N-acetyltransferase